MARFGLFEGLFSAVPQQTVEGDYMVQDGAYVRIFQTSLDPNRADAEVAVFRLKKFQVVREIDETGQRASG
jgi:hypothetical protein